MNELSRQDSRRDVIGDVQRTSGPRKSALAVTGVFGVLLLAALTVLTAATRLPVPSAVIFGTCFFIRLGMAGYFRPRMVPDTAAQAVGLARTAAGIVPLLFIVHFAWNLLTGSAFVPTPGAAMQLTAVSWIAALVSSSIAAQLLRRLWLSGRWRSRALLIGSGEMARQMTVEMRLRRDYGVDIVEGSNLAERTDSADALLDCLVGSGADRVIILPPDQHPVPTARLAKAAQTAISLNVPTFVVPGVYATSLGLDSMRPDRIRGIPVAQIQRSAHPRLSLAAKRLADILVASLALLLVSPILAVAAAAVKVTSPGPVLFRQPRVGRNGKVFDILKLRSMTESVDEHRERASSHRITPVGRVIRATFVDELPQLFNILRGDMTLVGPRPERVAFVDEGLQLYDGYDLRHRMPMGLTGLAQVAGLRGESTSVQERTRFDNLYIDHWSLGLDLQILMRTFAAVILQSRRIQEQLELSKAISDGHVDNEQPHVIDLRSIPRRQERSSA